MPVEEDLNLILSSKVGWMMGGGEMKARDDRIAAFFSLLDRWDRVEGAVTVVNGWPPAELMSSSDERAFASKRDGERVDGYGWRRGSSLLFT